MKTNRLSVIISLWFSAFFALPALAADFSVTVLRPEPRALVLPHMLMAAFSYESRTGNPVDPKKIKLFWDNEVLTQGLTITDRYLSFFPGEFFSSRPNVSGTHKFVLRFYNERNEVVQEEVVPLTVAEPVEFRDDERATATPDISQRGNLIVTNTYDDASYTKNNIIDGRLNYSVRKGKWYVATQTYFSSDEYPLAQPRHTIKIDLAYDRSIQLGIGDRYPSYHHYVLDGQRVRGIELNLKAFNHNLNTLNLNVVYGLANMGSDNFGYTGSGIQEAGIYKRRLLAINPEFGSGEVFHLGFIVLKAKDDPTSISIRTDSTGALLAGQPPKDNLVLGSDIIMRFWKRRISLYGNFALGLYTNDISNGILTKAQAQTMGMDDVPVIIKKYSGLLIMNSSSSILDSTISSMGQSVIYDFGVQLNLPLSTLTSYTDIKYQMIGPYYLSLGKENIESSRRGFNISQQLGLLGRKLNLGGSFGIYRNNLDEKMPSATTFTNYSISAQYSPAPFLPSLDITYSADNSLNNDTSAAYKQENVSSNVQFSTRYKLQTGPVNNQLSVFFGQGGFQTLGMGEVTNNNIGASVLSRFNQLPLETNVRFSTNRNSAGAGQRYSSIDGSGTYDIIQRKLDATASMGLMIYDNSVNNRFSTGLEAGYKINPKMDLDLSTRLYLISTGNQFFAQLQYVYRFFE